MNDNKQKYYRTVRDITFDFTYIFDVIPTGPAVGLFWHDENGEPTTDPEKVMNKIPVEIPKNRRAETLEDFKIVFEKEFIKHKANDRDGFRKRQIEIFQDKRDELKQFVNEDKYVIPAIQGLPEVQKTEQKNGMEFYHYIELLDRYIQFLQLFENSESTIEDKPESNEGENPYPRIFKENKHAQLFEYLHDSVERNELAEYSFIYRKMMKDKFIYDGVKQSEFKNWLNETYKIEPLDDLKTLTNCTTDHKCQLYQLAKRQFQC